MLYDLSRLPCNVSAISLISARNLLSRLAPASACRNSSINSTETPEKLLTKLSGFLISCAMPAVSWPSEASFCVCTRRSCVVRKSSNDFASSRVRASTLSNKRTFSIAIAAWSAKVSTRAICLSVNGSTSVLVRAITPIGIPSRSIGTARTVLKAYIFCASSNAYSGSFWTSTICTGRRCRRLRRSSRRAWRVDADLWRVNGPRCPVTW